MELSKNKQAVLEAYRKGYRVQEDGSIISHRANKLRLRKVKSKPYFYFMVYNGKQRKQRIIKVHQLAAYQKFGCSIFGVNVHIRHLDNNPENNRLDNIGIGTQSENMLDRPVRERVVHARKANAGRRKLSQEQADAIRKLYADGRSMKSLAKVYGVNPGTIWRLVNGQTYKGEVAESG